MEFIQDEGSFEMNNNIQAHELVSGIWGFYYVFFGPNKKGIESFLSAIYNGNKVDFFGTHNQATVKRLTPWKPP